MNLDHDDWAKLQNALDGAVFAAQDIWVDPDYTSEQNDRRHIISVLENTRGYVSRYFKPAQ